MSSGEGKYSGNARLKRRTAVTIERLGYRPLLAAAALLMACTSAAIAALFFHFKPGFQGSETYSFIARQLLETGSFQTTYRPPLYPLLLAGLMKLDAVFNGYISWESLGIAVNVALNVLSGVVLFALTYELTGKKSAAAVSVLLFLVNIVYQLEVLSKRETVFYIFLQLCLLYVWASAKRWYVRYPLLGALAGLLHLTRPTGILVLAALGIVESFSAVRIRWKLRNLVVLAGCFLLVIAPWIAATKRITGKTTIASSHNFGQGLYKGHNASFRNLFPWVDVDDMEPVMERMRGGRSMLEHEADPFFKEKAVEYIAANPASLWYSSALKVFAFISPFPTPFGRGTVVEENGILKLQNFRVRNVVIGITAAVYMLTLWYFCFRAVRSRELRSFCFLFLVLLLASIAAQCLTYSETRYRLPLDVFFVVLAAQGIAISLRSKSTVSGLEKREREEDRQRLQAGAV